MKHCITYFIYLLIIPFFLQAQSFSISHVPVNEYTEDDPVYMECLFNDDPGLIITLSIYARPSGNSGYQQYPMSFNGIHWSGRIPVSDLRPGGMEYFIMAELVTGGVISYPSANPFQYPLKILYVGEAVTTPQTSRKLTDEGFIDGDFIILSPEPGSVVESKDFIVAISLFNVPDINLESVQIEINGIDRTVFAQKSEEIITLTLPENMLRPGSYTITFRSENDFGTVFKPKTWTFSLIGEATARRRVSKTYAGQLSAEYRYEETQNIRNDLTRFTGRFTGTVQDVNLGISGTWVSNESPNYQPRNFITAFARTSYADIEIGMLYPEISRMTLYGNRVNGALFRLKLKYFDLTYVQGQLLREIGGRALLDTTSRVWNISSYTFARDIQIIQPVFNFGNKLSIKITGMHARDDSSSIDPVAFVADYNPDTDTYRLNGMTPSDNLVFDTNITLRLDQNRLIFSQNAAISLTNRDITGGAADSITLGEDIINIADRLPSLLSPERISYFFIINQNSTLPIPAELSDDLTGFKLYPLRVNEYPSLAFWTDLRLNYYNNYITWTYKQIAPEFISLAYPGMQSDIRISEISDRIRFFSNRLILTLKFSNQRDNLLGRKKEFVTRTNSASAGISVAPGPGLPTASLSYRYFIRQNEVSVSLDSIINQEGVLAIDQRIRNENLYQMFILTQPLKTGNIPSDVTINYVKTVRTDKIPDRPENFISPDYNMNLWSISMLTRWTPGFTQNISWSYMRNEIGNSSLFSYQTYLIKFENAFFREKVFGAVQGKLTTTGGDISFTQYMIIPEIRIILFENDLIINYQFNKLDQSGDSRLTHRFYTKYSYKL